MKNGNLVTTLLYVGLFSSCSFSPIPAAGTGIFEIDVPTPTVSETAKRIQFEEVGEVGVFDASLAHGGDGRIWMSYSAVELPSAGSVLSPINTRLAYSADLGATWQDAGVLVNESRLVALPGVDQVSEAIWLHEVSDLLYDPYAAPEKRWILVWHQYLRAVPAGSDQTVSLYEHGWIALRTAPHPLGPWSAPRKLFVGSLYDGVNDAASGRPAFRLNELFPSADGLGNCVAYTEPSIYANAAGIYGALKCAMGGNLGKIVLLRCNHDFTTCEYMGDFLDDNEAGRFGSTYNGFSAPEIVEVEETIYLFLTPTETDAKIYRGCFVFRVADLEAAALDKVNGGPGVILRLGGERGTFSGACSYDAASVASGVVYNQAELGEDIEYQLYRSEVNLE